MVKRVNLRGTSARSGRAPAPYTKYQKRPYLYPDAAELRKRYPVKFAANGNRLGRNPEADARHFTALHEQYAESVT